MKLMLAVLGIVLLSASVASAGWRYVPAPVVYGPAPVVATYGPAGSVYAYPSPYVVARPVVVNPGPVVYGANYYGYGPAVVYPSPYVVRPRMYMPGQPVRNVLRAAF